MSPKVTEAPKIITLHMPTHTFATHLILALLDQFNISGNTDTQISNQNKCGGDFVEHGFRVSRDFWRRALNGSGITLLMSLIGMYTVPKLILDMKLTASLQPQACLSLVGYPLAPEGSRFICI